MIPDRALHHDFGWRINLSSLRTMLPSRRHVDIFNVACRGAERRMATSRLADAQYRHCSPDAECPAIAYCRASTKNSVAAPLKR